jgi:hypothetical protein
MAKPTVFDQLYPGRFLKAGLLLGKKVTLTVKDVDLEGLEGEDGKKKQKAIVSFNESPMELVMCKTNGICLKAMFGPTLADWLGKRVTIFESQWNGEPCIRIWGSPDLKQDLKVSVQLPRRRPFDMVLHVVKKGAANNSDPAPATPIAVVEPRIKAAFEILDWTEGEQQKFLADNAGKSTADLLSQLNMLIDESAMENA